MLSNYFFTLFLILILAFEGVYFFIFSDEPEKIIASNATVDTQENFIQGDFFGVIYQDDDSIFDIQSHFPKVEELKVVERDLNGPCSEIKFGKCIEIDISDQKFYTYQNGFLIGEYLTSTGAPGRDTKIGRFQVQSKYEMAHGYIGGVHYKMPYWLGIYYAGESENGIHELPYINGVKETRKDLGKRVSHGCVRLDEGVAKKVYQWAEIGTLVIIHN